MCGASSSPTRGSGRAVHFGHVEAMRPPLFLCAAALAKAARMTELPKTFDPADIESRWYAHWEETGLFRPDRPGAEPWTIVNPPPNVTGSLHIGHALDNTLQDILVRHARLKGKDALVGGRHRSCRHRHADGGRAPDGAPASRSAPISRASEFVAKVWEWKAESGGADHPAAPPARLLDGLGERALHDGRGLFSKAVLKVFVELYKRGPALPRQAAGQLGPGPRHRDQRPRGRDARDQGQVLAPALSARGRHRASSQVATTRPETMLADMAVAVNPTDERYTALIGKKVRLPITGRADPDRRRRTCRSRTRLGRGEDHAGA